MMGVSDEVLRLVRERPRRSHEVREELVRRGFDEDQVRGAIAAMWDEGRINVGLDQRLSATDPDAA